MGGEEGEATRDKSYSSRGQSLAVGVWAHRQGTVEPYPSIRGAVSGLERQKEKHFKSVFLLLHAACSHSCR